MNTLEATVNGSVLSVCERQISVQYTDRHIRQLILAGYGSMTVAELHRSASIHYQLDRKPATGQLRIMRGTETPLLTTKDSEFLFMFEKDMTIELQRQRADLFFLHAAVVEYQGKTALISAPSGTGKSTLTFALLHSGFNYLSDELAPVELDTLRVHPYPHALCLKAAPPEPYRLPVETLDAGRTLHAPPSVLPCKTITDPQTLNAIFFIRREGAAGGAELKKLGDAEVVARLYANSLNALAHAGDGLDAAVRIAERVPGYELDSTNLGAAMDAIRSALAQ